MPRQSKRDAAPDPTTVGGRIRIARRLCHMTPLQLAHALGLKSAVGISQWEKNRRLPETPTVLKLAEVLGTTVDWIYRGEGTAPDGITADVPRGTLADAPGKTEQAGLADVPLRGDALIALVKDYGAKVDALRIQGGQQGRIDGMTEGLALAIRHMFMTDPDPDRMARTIAEILLSPDDLEEPPSGPHRMQGHAEAKRTDEPRQQRRYRSA